MLRPPVANNGDHHRLLIVQLRGLLIELRERIQHTTRNDWEREFEPFQARIRELTPLTTTIQPDGFGLFDIVEEERVEPDGRQVRIVFFRVYDAFFEQLQTTVIRSFTLSKSVFAGFGTPEAVRVWRENPPLGKPKNDAVCHLGNWIRWTDSELQRMETSQRPEPPASLDEPAEQADALPLAGIVLSVYTGRAVDGRFAQIEQVAKSNRKVDERLWEIDGIVPLPPVASAELLSKLLNCSKTAILGTSWWKSKRKGSRQETEGVRNRIHAERSKSMPRQPDAEGD
jgi:hypothetical protein